MRTLGYNVSIRQVQRYIQEVITKVKRLHQPVILMNRNQPEIALLSLEQLKEFKRLKFAEKIKDHIRKMGVKEKEIFE